MEASVDLGSSPRRTEQGVNSVANLRFRSTTLAGSQVLVSNAFGGKDDTDLIVIR